MLVDALGANVASVLDLVDSLSIHKSYTHVSLQEVWLESPMSIF